MTTALQGAAFDPAATHAMGEAFDRACRSLYDFGHLDSVKTIIAIRIIDVARDGERDPDSLCERAMQALDFSINPVQPGGEAFSSSG
jgi:hypothetical protein